MHPSNPSPASFRILMAEDRLEDVELARFAMEQQGVAAEWKVVQSEEALLEALREQDYDVLIVDYHLPGFSPLESIERVRGERPDLPPVILFTGTLEERRVAEVVQQGIVDDYVLKRHFSRLPSAVLHALAFRQAQRRVRELETLITALFSAMGRIPMGVLIFDAQCRLLYANPMALSFWPDLPEAPSSQPVQRLGNYELSSLLPSPGNDGPVALHLPQEEGRWVKVRRFWLGPEEGDRFQGYVFIAYDVMEERARYDQLYLQSRLAAIGELASGVAHEINNPLQSIVGFAELAKEQLEARGDSTSSIHRALEVIIREGMRAAYIVRELQNFAERQMGTKTSKLSPQVIVEEVLRLVEKPFWVHGCQVVREFEENLPPIKVRVGEIQQALLNVLLNARDALLTVGGGQIFVRVKRGQHPLTRQPAVVFEVEDTGPGITAEVRQHLFIPFFTTKDPDKGTGLGLSTAYRIITAHGGQIQVISEPGKGALFRIFLPIALKEEEEEGTLPSLRLLFIGEDVSLMDFLRTMAQGLGHRVEYERELAVGLSRALREDFDALLVKANEGILESIRRWGSEMERKVILVAGEDEKYPCLATLAKSGRPILIHPIQREELQRALMEVVSQTG